MALLGSVENVLPQVGEFPRQFRKDEGETWVEYSIVFIITLSEIASIVGVVAFTAALLGYQPVVDFVNNTTIPFVVVSGQINLVAYLVLTGTFAMVPLALFGSLIADEKEHVVDDSVTIIIFNAIALVLVLFIGPTGISGFVFAALLTAAFLYGFLFLTMVMADRRGSAR